MFKSYRKFRANHRRGTAAIEFAIIAPPFLMVIATCAEFARLSMVRNLAQNAAYEAARFVITEGATVQDGIDRANTVMERLGAQNVTVTINGSDGSTDENGQVNGEIGMATQQVTCLVQLPLKDNSIILPDYLIGDITISAAMTVRTERYRGYYDGQSTN